VSSKDLPARIEKLQARVEESEKETRELRRRLLAGSIEAGTTADGRAAAVTTVKGIAVHVQRLDGLTMAELRDTADTLKHKMGSGVVALGSAAEGKAFVVVSVTKDLTGRIKANALIKEISPAIGGGGGGRPDFAQSGGPGAAGLDRALELVPIIVERQAA
jgi:alanyl-tRNA synthetase